MDARVHSRLIGSKGRNIRKIMDQYKVDIKFARSNENPNVITVMGQPENVEECKDYLLNVVEEYVRVSASENFLKTFPNLSLPFFSYLNFSDFILFFPL